MLKALVLRAPGINCDRETAQACRMVGFETDLVHVNQLLKNPDLLLEYAFLAIPGGFSYGDDMGAGTFLARNLTIHLGKQLRQFVDEGRPVLGICNGFQVLVRSGLLPGNAPSKGAEDGTLTLATLTENTSAQFECRWVTLGIESSKCIFTRGLEHPIELPVAHGEGQFVPASPEMLQTLQGNGQIPLVYLAPEGAEESYPHNPNGSIGNIAGVCNAQGNVLGLMPHPERYVTGLQHPLRRGNSNGEGDGLLLFKNAYSYAQSIQKQVYAATISRTTGTTQSAIASSYAASGVDIAASDKAKEMMKEAVRATQGPEILAGMGAFAGVFSLDKIGQMTRPALVASTDGVGTKTLLAAQTQRFTTVGYDIVNHSVNDLLTQGAQPLFFMDYLAMGKLDPQQAAQIVQGVAEACQKAGCALLGGETSEMPDVYLPGAFDLAGTIVGVIEQNAIVDGTTIQPGDIILGFPSSGLHTNGYSLARKVFAPYPLDTVFPELGESLADALLRPHRSYLHEVQRLRAALQKHGEDIKGMAHITGGGFEGNISRILPAGTQAVIETGAWQVPPLFTLIQRLGQVERDEMYRALNMGVGMVLVLSPEAATEARSLFPELLTVGSIVSGNGEVVLH